MTIYNLTQLSIMARSQKSLRVYLAALTVAILHEREKAPAMNRSQG